MGDDIGAQEVPPIDDGTEPGPQLGLHVLLEAGRQRRRPGHGCDDARPPLRCVGRGHLAHHRQVGDRSGAIAVEQQHRALDGGRVGAEPQGRGRSRTGVRHLLEQARRAGSVRGDHHRCGTDVLPGPGEHRGAVDPLHRRAELHGAGGQGSGDRLRERAHAGGGHRSVALGQHPQDHLEPAGRHLEPGIELDPREQRSPEALDHPLPEAQVLEPAGGGHVGSTQQVGGRDHGAPRPRGAGGGPCRGRCRPARRWWWAGHRAGASGPRPDGSDRRRTPAPLVRSGRGPARRGRPTGPARGTRSAGSGSPDRAGSRRRGRCAPGRRRHRSPRAPPRPGRRPPGCGRRPSRRDRRRRRRHRGPWSRGYRGPTGPRAHGPVRSGPVRRSFARCRARTAHRADRDGLATVGGCPSTCACPSPS